MARFERSAGGIPSIALAGDYDLRRDEELVALFGQVADASSVIIDLTAVTFLTASSLGCLVRLKKSLPEGATVWLVGLQPQCNEIFQRTQLSSLFEISD